MSEPANKRFKPEYEYTTSKLTLDQGVQDLFYSTAEFSVDASGGEDSVLLLSLHVDRKEEESGDSTVIGIDYFSESQILELYFFLKANLARKYKKII